MSRFARLCEISSPTGEEREIADAVRAELESFGFEVEEDDAAAATVAGAGNLICRIPGKAPGFVTFAAHLDTVPHEVPVEVVLEEGIYRSRGDTILGADNKAAVTVLVEMASRYSANSPPIGIELLFTVAEEQGLLGAAALDTSKLLGTVGYVLDHATDIGEVITVAPSLHRIRVDFQGIEAHAGLDPEGGRSAIVAAARAIDTMDLGRVDDMTTANIGMVAGGSSGNIIPGRCRISGEARSSEPGRVVDVIAAMSDACLKAAGDCGCEVDIVTEEVFRDYRIPDDSPAMAIAEAALRSLDIEPKRVSTGGGSDANAFRAVGIDSVLLANGTYDNHTASESVPQANLGEMLEVCEAILREAVRSC